MALWLRHRFTLWSPLVPALLVMPRSTSQYN